MKKGQNPKPKRRAKILCKVTDSDGDTMVFYIDKTWRYQRVEHHEDGRWDLAFFEETGHHMFMYQDGDGEWQTDYSSNSEEEVKIGETIARALADDEMHKILKGKDGKRKASDSDAQRP